MHKTPKDKLRLALAYLVEHQLAPTPVNYAAAYRAVSTGAADSPKVTRSELVLCAELIDILQALFPNGEWLSRQIEKLRSAATAPDAVHEQLAHFELTLAELAKAEPTVMVESAEVAQQFKATVASVYAEVSSVLREVEGSEKLMPRYADKLSNIKCLTEASAVLNEVVAHVRLLSDSLRTTTETLRNTQTFLEVTTSRLSEVAEEAKANANAADTDPLTGVRNRRGLEKAVSAMAQGDAALILVDIDNFKRINDTFGHAVGDEVIHALGQLLEANARHSDIVARLGGEEFVLVLPGLTVGQASQVGQRLLAAMRGWADSEVARRHKLRVTLSGGVAGWRNCGDALGQLKHALDVADHRLYAAKRAGKDRMVSETPRGERTAGAQQLNTLL